MYAMREIEWCTRVSGDNYPSLTHPSSLDCKKLCELEYLPETLAAREYYKMSNLVLT